MKLLYTISWMVLACALSAAAVPQRRTASAPSPDPASTALFVNSNPDSARALAENALRQNPRNMDALFAEMEAAALEADTAGELDAALRLCESGTNADDARISIAAARVLDLAGNTQQFREVLPRLRKLIATGAPQPNLLRMALTAAAAEGIPGAPVRELARQAGLVTDWQVAGPFGRYSNVAFDREFAPEQDGVSQATYDGHAVESFRFDDGTFSLADYFSPAGVFYAAANFEAVRAGSFRMRLESEGTLEVFVDGVSVVRKDDRLRATADIVMADVQLTPGQHRVLVKFIPSAAPFRIALFSPREGTEVSSVPTSAKGRQRRGVTANTISEPAAGYVKAAERFWMGDYSGAIARLSELKRQRPSAAVDYLLAQAWSQVAVDAPEVPALLESALKQAPLAAAAEYEIAARAYDAGQNEEAYTRARRVADAHPDFAPAQHLLAEVAVRMKWPAEAAQAFENELRLWPVCSTVHRASRFFASLAAYERAAQLEKQLDGCAPGSLAYAESLSEAGHHAEAAAAIGKTVREHPLDRESRLMLARELESVGDTQEAEKVRADLAVLAPNAAHFHTAQRASLRARDFGAEAFYTAYRRNGLEMIRKTANRRYSGGPAVLILHDRVAELGADGSVALYVHKITRVLNRDGIERYGEVRLPDSAELLELRTIKQDGAIAEPEFSQHKSSISMPALAPGDAIEEEYVVRHQEGGTTEHPEAFTYTFGSFSAPMMYARFVVLAPQRDMVIDAPGAPELRKTSANGTTAYVWERENVPQSTEESSAPRTGTLPTVRVLEPRPGEWVDLREFYRDELIQAVRIGPRVEASARELRGASPEETARNLYRMVTTRVRSTDSEFESGEVAAAEDTLANYAGSRTTALLAMARANNLDAELLLAREIARQRPASPEQDAYSHPLVLFRFGEKAVVADAETPGLAFGVVPPTLSREDAIAVPLEAEELAGEIMVALPASAGDETSVADGDITFDAEGNLTARLTIRMGASRGSQMRSILQGVQPSGRGRFFEQLALRIFPGVASATGEVRNEHDAERPVELVLTCRAPRFLAFNGPVADMEQLAPALGLRKMYGVGSRQLPLYVDMPLIERTVFRVHLPGGSRLAARAADLHLRNEFGSYTLKLTETGPSEFEVLREFRIPAQVIPPERFGTFANFARQIDEAERQRITIGQAAAVTASTGAK